MDFPIKSLVKRAQAYQQELPPRPDVPVDPEQLSPAELAAYIDHTVLKAEATPAQIEQLCLEAVQHGFAAVCVNSIFASQAAAQLTDTNVALAVVVGFPLGAMATPAKVAETRYCMEAGANEIDMVLPVGLLKAGEYSGVLEDIAAVVEVTHAQGGLVKVIFETALLEPFEKIMACVLSEAAGADYVKTSTGFGPSGATEADVELMRRIVSPAVGVKASGGIRDLAAAQAMIRAGANRLGTSSGVKIMAALQGQETSQ